MSPPDAYIRRYAGVDSMAPTALPSSLALAERGTSYLQLHAVAMNAPLNTRSAQGERLHRKIASARSRTNGRCA
jgi:hypothetical protein